MADHALHNEEVCAFLHNHNKYFDWVVTTAFYSALHFVQFEIFPLENHGDKYVSFDQYYSEKIKNRMSKHKATHQLVCKHLKTCGARYKWLMDACKTARYNDYHVLPEIAEEAVINLAEIKSRIKKLETA